MAWVLTDHRRTYREPKVPRTTPYFWLGKGVSTAMGEAASDYLVHSIHPVPAVLLGFVGFVVALILQLRASRYLAWTYWFAVGMVGIFGTMAADVVHVGMGIPYFISAPFFAIVLAAVFMTWHATEHTLSVHAINTPRRELFYWAAVVATFALGTAAGDLTAVTFHIGYLPSIGLYAAIIMIPALGYWRGRWSPVFAFWFAYVVTRPLGASVADGFGKPASLGGLGYGDGLVALVLAIMMGLVVAYLALTRVDVQREGRHLRRSYAVVEDTSGNIVGIVPPQDAWLGEEGPGRGPS
jgi:uncharacterized membrane-anchored protein